MLKIIDCKDIDLREEAEYKLKLNKQKFGKRYCPCSMIQNDDTVCPCKEFREQNCVGECHCGRYEKIEVN